MVTTERVYTIPLREIVLRNPPQRRAPRAMHVIREYVEKHTKSPAKLSVGINELIWMHGIQEFPPRVKVKVTMIDGVAFTHLPDEKAPVKQKAETKRADKKEKTPEVAPAIEAKKEDAKPAPATEAPVKA